MTPTRRGTGGPLSALLFALVVLSLNAHPAVAGLHPPGAFDLGLIQPAQLAQEKGLWTVLDARPKADWNAGHIPRARSFSWEDYTMTDAGGVPYRVWPPEAMAKALGAMGINEHTPLAVYGDADSSWGGEGWACWVLAWLGHKGPIRLLAGGIQAWNEQRLPVTVGPDEHSPTPLRYQYRLRPELDFHTAELKTRESSVVLIDTRASLEWVWGHLPGAIHIPWTDFYTGHDRQPLSPEALRKLLKAHHVDVAKPVVYYCAGGVRSGFAWTVHQLAGLSAARNYEGGMEAWKRRSRN